MPDACLTDCHWGSLFTCVCIHMDVEDELCFVCVRGMEGAHHTHTHRRTHRPPLHPPPQPLSPKQILAFVERHMTYDPHTQPNPTQHNQRHQDKTKTQRHFHSPTPKQILAFVERRMTQIAPNVCGLVGSKIASQLMGLAGGLVALSRIPANHIQVNFWSGLCALYGCVYALTLRFVQRTPRPPKRNPRVCVCDVGLTNQSTHPRVHKCTNAHATRPPSPPRLSHYTPNTHNRLHTTPYTQPHR